MAKNTTVYRCTECGYESGKWMGQCPSCHSWNTMEESASVQATPSVNAPKAVQGGSLKKLSSVSANVSDRVMTGIGELNRVLGGGLTQDSVVILAAKPGAGKSTLLMQLAQNMAAAGKRVLYVSGEESESQLKSRAERILNGLSDNIWVAATVSMNELLAAVASVDPDLIIVDSIQTFSLEEYSSRPGTPTQIVECTNVLLSLAKNPMRPRAVFMAGQLTKEDELAGVRTLEHMVDTVLFMESDEEEELRILSASKNRFGSTGEMGFFTMTETGLKEIENPSEFFVTKRAENEEISGTALCAIREGTRPVVAEIEALVSRSFTAYPSRVSECMKRDSLATLISILEERGGLSLYDKNIVIKAAGGLKLTQTSVNLTVLMAIASSLLETAIPAGTVFLADVGLTGELKRVPAMESLIRELDRMQFSRVYVPRETATPALRKKLEHIQLVPCNTLKEVLLAVFADKLACRRKKEENNA